MSKRTWRRRSLGADAIREALRRHGGNVTHAAAELGVDRRSLGRWLMADPSLRPAPEPAREPLSQAEATRAARRDRRVVQARKRYEARLRELTGSTDPRGVLRIEPDSELARLGRAHLDTFRRVREALIG